MPSAIPSPALRGRSGIPACLSAPSSVIERSVRLKLPVFGPSRRCDGATTASADFCRSITAPLDAVGPQPCGYPRGLHGRIDRPPGVRRVTFAPSTRRIYARPTESLRTSSLIALSSAGRSPPMRFVFLGPELCLPLPSHAASQRRGCGSARGTRDQGSQRTYTSKSSRHARRTTKRPHGGTAPYGLFARVRAGGDQPPAARLRKDPAWLSTRYLRRDVNECNAERPIDRKSLRI